MAFKIISGDLNRAVSSHGLNDITVKELDDGVIFVSYDGVASINSFLIKKKAIIDYEPDKDEKFIWNTKVVSGYLASNKDDLNIKVSHGKKDGRKLIIEVMNLLGLPARRMEANLCVEKGYDLDIVNFSIDRFPIKEMGYFELGYTEFIEFIRHMDSMLDKKNKSGIRIELKGKKIFSKEENTNYKVEELMSPIKCEGKGSMCVNPQFLKGLMSLKMEAGAICKVYIKDESPLLIVIEDESLRYFNAVSPLVNPDSDEKKQS